MRRLRGAEESEARLPMAHGTRAARRLRPAGEQEWVQVIVEFFLIVVSESSPLSSLTCILNSAAIQTVVNGALCIDQSIPPRSRSTSFLLLFLSLSYNALSTETYRMLKILLLGQGMVLRNEHLG